MSCAPSSQAIVGSPRWRSYPRGGLVAFPTENRLGLGADALSDSAVGASRAKERPRAPFDVHRRRSALEAWPRASRLARGMCRARLARALTLVLPRASAVPPPTVGWTCGARVPSHPLVARADRAAPSHRRALAKPLGRPSPTRAELREDLDGRIELILDGGPTPVGVESTVLDMTTEPPMLLRPGGVTLEQLRDCLGAVAVLKGDGEEAAGRSPGLRYRHYAPRAQVILVDRGTGESAVAPWLEAGRPVALMAQRSLSISRPGLLVRTMPEDLETYARDLFAVLRELDSAGVEGIFVERLRYGMGGP